MGLCLPTTCNETHIIGMIEDYFGDNSSVLVQDYGIQIDELEIDDLKLSEEYYSKLSVILFWYVM